MRMISIDPGLNGTGWAVWRSNGKLWSHGIIRISGKDMPIRMTRIANALREIMLRYAVLKLYIEYPMKFQGNKGTMVADRGDLVKLAVLAGCIVGNAPDHVRSTYVEVIRWKGQLPKDVVIRRIKKILPTVKATSHDFDAIGIGLFVQGKF